MNQQFARAKSEILSNIHYGIDFSPKGSIDAPIVEMITFINQLAGYVTTSSCSGRISCFRDDNRCKGIEWLLLIHRTVAYEDILKSIQNTISDNSFIMLKCEPFILHVQCQDIHHATELHQLALSSGFRESGIGIGNRKTMVAVRTTANCMEIPLVIDGKYLLNEDSLPLIIDECNKRLISNFCRIDKFLLALKSSYAWSCAVSSPPPPYNGWGHTVSVIDGFGIFISGGYKKNASNNQVSRTANASLLPFTKSIPKTQATSQCRDIMAPSSHRAYMHAASAVFDLRKKYFDSLLIDIDKEVGIYLDKLTLVLVSGGRESPLVALPCINQIYAIYHNDDAVVNNNSDSYRHNHPTSDMLDNGWFISHENISQVGIPCDSDIPCSRWGHSLTMLDPTRYILVGGRDMHKAYGDAYILELVSVSCNIRSKELDSKQGSVQVSVSHMTLPHLHVTLRWTKIRNETNPYREIGIFFHSCCYVCDGSVLVYGGLDQCTISEVIPSSSSVSTWVYSLSVNLHAYNHVKYTQSTNTASTKNHSETSKDFFDVEVYTLDTSLLSSLLQWNKVHFSPISANSLQQNLPGRFAHTMTNIGAKSFAVIGGCTYDDLSVTDCFRELMSSPLAHVSVVPPVPQSDNNVIAVWDLLLSPNTTAINFPSYCITPRHIPVHTSVLPFLHAASGGNVGQSCNLELGLKGSRCHHQTAYDAKSKTLYVFGGGMDCMGFGPCFNPTLALKITMEGTNLGNEESKLSGEYTSAVSNPKTKAKHTKSRPLDDPKVMAVSKDRVREVKVYLERNGWLDKDYRITPCDPQQPVELVLNITIAANTSSLESDSSSLSPLFSIDSNAMAIPVTSAFVQTLSQSYVSALTSNGDVTVFHAALGGKPVVGKGNVESGGTVEWIDSEGNNVTEIFFKLFSIPAHVFKKPKRNGSAQKEARNRPGGEDGSSELENRLLAPDNVSILFLHQTCMMNKLQGIDYKNSNPSDNSTSSTTTSSHVHNYEKSSVQESFRTNKSSQDINISKASSDKLIDTSIPAPAHDREVNDTAQDVILVDKRRVREVKVYLESNHWLEKSCRITSYQSPSVDSTDSSNRCSTNDTTNPAQFLWILASHSSFDSFDMNRLCSDDTTEETMAVPVTKEFVGLIRQHSNVMISGVQSISTAAARDVHVSHASDGGGESDHRWIDDNGEDVVEKLNHLFGSSVSKIKRSTKNKREKEGEECLPQIESEHCEKVDAVVIRVVQQYSCMKSKINAVSENIKASAFLNDCLQRLKSVLKISMAMSYNPSLLRALEEDIPLKFEIVGDVLMIPEGSLERSEWSLLDINTVYEGLWGCFGHGTHNKLTRIAKKAKIALGPKRESQVEILWMSSEFQLQFRGNLKGGVGSASWVTVIENGIKFGFDITKVMFCSGNVTERMRASTFNCKDQVVVDLYAGIGYYTVPFLLHGGAKVVHACEWNSNSVSALRENLRVANISPERYAIYENDNEITAPLLVGVADRVSLGLIPSSVKGWPLAVQVLKSSGGTIHVHENVHYKSFEQFARDTCKTFEELFASFDIAQKFDTLSHGAMRVKCSHIEKVKSYSPKICHIVCDLVVVRSTETS